MVSVRRRGLFSMVELYASVITGFENVSSREINSTLNVDASKGRGHVRFELDYNRIPEVLPSSLSFRIFAYFPSRLFVCARLTTFMQCCMTMIWKGLQLLLWRGLDKKATLLYILERWEEEDDGKRVDVTR
ncbi:hypothetical protein OESDEN_09235 [Oesophagostomum dentatum]|uniref:Uncharacterized protein n=1 Tax=Oesophagostomum dentatum TaxID=61180 RepID=A0A0B1T681_OESDE|nr:hypothetical protein OESDEN_09235 [Oesophagostomum dentatum]